MSDSVLATLQAHPRLLFTRTAEEDLRARLKTDNLLSDFVAKLRERSDQFAALPPVPYTEVPFAEFGFHMLMVSREVQARILVHAFLWRLTGELTHCDRVWREAEAALAYPWSTSHFLDAAEMLVAFAFAYDWLFDTWSPEQRATLREAMVSRIIRPGLAIHETKLGPSAFFPTTTSNWNSVCKRRPAGGRLGCRRG